MIFFFFFWVGRWDLQLCKSFALLSLTSDDTERILLGQVQRLVCTFLMELQLGLYRCELMLLTGVSCGSWAAVFSASPVPGAVSIWSLHGPAPVFVQ